MSKALVMAVVSCLMIAKVSAEAVTVTGILVDKWCWNTLNGVALDTGANLVEDPTDHTVHCLVEVPRCRDSGFVIVYQKDGTGDYEIQYELDEPGNERARDLLLLVPEADRFVATGYEVTVSGTSTTGSTLLVTDDSDGSMTGRVPEGGSNAISVNGMCFAVMAAALALTITA